MRIVQDNSGLTRECRSCRCVFFCPDQLFKIYSVCPICLKKLFRLVDYASLYKGDNKSAILTHEKVESGGII